MSIEELQQQTTINVQEKAIFKYGSVFNKS